MSRKARRLSTEDRILWNRVAKTVTPLPGSALEPEPEPEAAETGVEVPTTDKRKPLPRPLHQPAAQTAPSHPGVIDTKTRARIAKGRLSLDARVDLHGLTQSEAHGLLLSFLQRAHSAGLRHVLVITGKGSSPASEGVLRRAVPSWFATQPFRGLVSGHSAATRQHGGDGALYVRLRRKRDAGA
jgi:DNA-nicking Smr family endonuclease